MSAQKIIIFLGSTRQGRMGERVAKFVQQTVEANGMEPILLGTYCNFLHA
jgi:NAD(P)H-dependent FMN reductase